MRLPEAPGQGFMFRLAATCLVAALLVACTETGPKLTKVPGSMDAKTRNLVALWVVARDGSEKPVLVTAEYAVLPIWCNNEKVFYVFDNQAKTVFRTSDYEMFLQEVDRLPRAIAIQRLDTCTVSRIQDMPDAQRQRLEQVMKAGDRQWAIGMGGLDHETVCYCESAGLRFP